MKVIKLIVFFIGITFSSYAQKQQPVPFTLADRDRIILTEQRINALSKSVDERFDGLSRSVDERFDGLSKSVDERFDALNKSMEERFEAQQKQLDNIFSLMLFLLGGIMGLIGFIIYDRRTILRPVTKKQQQIENVLIQYAKENKEFKEILKRTGIL